MAASSPEAVIRTGCAGWSLPRAVWAQFPGDGSHLQRYAGQLNAAEINSSFYRPHPSKTYTKWADAVPLDFQFSVKLPKTISHERRLKDCVDLLGAFLAEIKGLGPRLGCLLLQLPPSLALDESLASAFLAALRLRHDGPVALEARHASWFTPDADALLAAHQVGRVLADPVRFDAGRWPGGDPALVYLRLHGSPRMYYSAYERPLLDALAARLSLAAASGAKVWCVFDNTASGAAVTDALYTRQALSKCARR